jgi:hypothetical protein
MQQEIKWETSFCTKQGGYATTEIFCCQSHTFWEGFDNETCNTQVSFYLCQKEIEYKVTQIPVLLYESQ